MLLLGGPSLPDLDEVRPRRAEGAGAADRTWRPSGSADPLHGTGSDVDLSLWQEGDCWKKEPYRGLIAPQALDAENLGAGRVHDLRLPRD